MRDRKLIEKLDIGILLVILALVCFGLIGIGVAKRLPLEGGETLAERLSSFNMYYVKLHLIWFATGLGLMTVVLLFDYASYKQIAVFLYWAVVAMLLFLNVRGVIRGGAQSWFEIGPFTLQPSEFGKLAIIIMMAKKLAGKEDEDEPVEEEPQWKKILSCAIIVGIPLVLVVLQPDFGTAMVYIVIFFVMLFVGGIKIWWLLGLVGAAAAAAPTLYFTVLSEEQQHRILTFLNPELDPMGQGYQVMQAKTAIGSGRIFGKGILSGNTLSQLNFLPEPHTDFIYPVIVEALGFIGGAAIIFLFMLLILRTIRISRKAKDKFGSYIVAGVCALMMAHIVENIGMTMGLMPVTGIPLPFISYGGTFMYTCMIAYGLVLNVGMRSQKSIFRRTQ
jgi:rod shape determining protein RodA